VDAAELRRDLENAFSGAVTFSGEHDPSDLHDESLHERRREPFAVARPRSTADVVALARWAYDHEVPITPRGSGTGLSGGAHPSTVVSSSLSTRCASVLRVDERDHVAVVQAGITLRELNEALLGTGLHYPVYPGELSGSLGGNVNTNAGGMRAVRHGVTRQHVLGTRGRDDGRDHLEDRRPGDEEFVGLRPHPTAHRQRGHAGPRHRDHPQTLADTPALSHHARALQRRHAVRASCPTLISSGLDALAARVPGRHDHARPGKAAGDLHLGVDPVIAEQSSAYLIVVLETRTREQLDADLEAAAELLGEAGALDVYVLEGSAASQLIQARERSLLADQGRGGE
jgi:glycolate oxidase